MSPQRTQQLITKFPRLFAEVGSTPQQSCMAFGIECGDGWYTILEALCETLSREGGGSRSTLSFDGSEGVFEYEFPYVIFTQIKEKYGTLRIYHTYEVTESFLAQEKLYPKTAQIIREALSGQIDGAIDMAESLSARTCEETGAPGILMSRGGWYRTVSQEVAKRDGFSVSSLD